MYLLVYVLFLLLSPSVTAIGLIATTYVGSGTPSSLAKNFNDWIDSNNGKEWCKIELAEIPGFRMGTRARFDIAIGEDYLRLPWHLIINEDSIYASDVGEDFRELQQKYKLDVAHILMFFMYYELNRPDSDPSFWKPYIDTLPASFNIPIFWDEDELKELRGTDVDKLSKEYKQKTKNEWNKLNNIVAENSHLFGEKPRNSWNYDIYLWLNALVDSRTIWINGRHRSFLPMLDMVNNKNHPTKVHRTEKITNTNGKTETITKSIWSVKSGDQLFENYGSSNQHNLLYHGFVLEDNSYDTIELEMPMPDKSLFPIFRQMRIMPRLIIQSLELKKFMDGKLNNLDREVQSIESHVLHARLMKLPVETALQLLNDSSGQSKIFKGEYSTKNNVDALQMITNLLDVKINSSYVNDESTDETLLQNILKEVVEVSDNQRTAILFRVQQKRLFKTLHLYFMKKLQSLTKKHLEL